MKETITVCAACLTAACWHGTHSCYAIKPGLVEKTREELAAMALEHPSNWDICNDCMTACQGQCPSRRAKAVSSRLRGGA